MAGPWPGHGRRSALQCCRPRADAARLRADAARPTAAGRGLHGAAWPMLPERFEEIQIRSRQQEQSRDDSRCGHNQPQKFRRFTDHRPAHEQSHDPKNNELCPTETDKRQPSRHADTSTIVTKQCQITPFARTPGVSWCLSPSLHGQRAPEGRRAARGQWTGERTVDRGGTDSGPGRHGGWHADGGSCTHGVLSRSPREFRGTKDIARRPVEVVDRRVRTLGVSRPRPGGKSSMDIGPRSRPGRAS